MWKASGGEEANSREPQMHPLFRSKSSTSQRLPPRAPAASPCLAGRHHSPGRGFSLSWDSLPAEWSPLSEIQALAGAFLSPSPSC